VPNPELFLTGKKQIHVHLSTFSLLPGGNAKLFCFALYNYYLLNRKEGGKGKTNSLS